MKRHLTATRTATLLACAVMLALLICADPCSSAADASCHLEVVMAKCAVVIQPTTPGRSDSGGGSGSGSVARVTDCGSLGQAVVDGVVATSPACAALVPGCLVLSSRPDPGSNMVVTTVYQAGSNTPIGARIDCAATGGPPAPPLAAIRAEATRRAPQLRAATGGTRYLINAAIVYHLTPNPTGTSTGSGADSIGSTSAAGLAEVVIPPFTLAGHTFIIRLRLTASSWNWGDGTSTDYTDHPAGQPYRPDQPCASRTDCPGYIAHTYLQPGRYTTTATATWTATYTLDTNPQPTPIPGTLTTTASPTTITTYQAHAELVAQ